MGEVAGGVRDGERMAARGASGDVAYTGRYISAGDAVAAAELHLSNDRNDCAPDMRSAFDEPAVGMSNISAADDERRGWSRIRASCIGDGDMLVG